MMVFLSSQDFAYSIAAAKAAAVFPTPVGALARCAPPGLEGHQSQHQESTNMNGHGFEDEQSGLDKDPCINELPVSASGASTINDVSNELGELLSQLKLMHDQVDDGEQADSLHIHNNAINDDSKREHHQHDEHHDTDDEYGYPSLYDCRTKKHYDNI